MKTKKLLFVMPHASTGGQPQYVVKQIETFKDQFDISVVEANFYGEDYVVQRNRIRSMVPFYSLYGNQGNLPTVIKKIEPDIVYFQELPESFLITEVLDQVYSPKRKYNILVTTHSSATRPSQFLYSPDKIVAVSHWQKEIFLTDSPLESQIDLWEYPIEQKIRVHTKVDARNKLGMPINGTRILNVGLFTAGKNQGEIFEYARLHPDQHFDFVGNQAINFKDYWEPLMANKPNNVKVWGERNDTDLFYQAADEFYFSSKFELMPLVVKEALSWGLPVKMHRLETYGTDYDNNPLVTFI